MIDLHSLLQAIVGSSELHARWLNTLSFLENCGARKISACEHPTLVKEEMLKHSAEEFRHAHHLKRQIQKISQSPLKTYSLNEMLGGMKTLHYLATLDMKTSRYFKAKGLSKEAIKATSYLLVTYAIELRAEALYPIYDDILRKISSKVTVKSILLEEKEHLDEMRVGLKVVPNGFLHAEQVCAWENELYQEWLSSITLEININPRYFPSV